MNSKQRVQAAIARQPVDRVPLGLYAVDHDTVEAVIGRPTYVRNQVATWIAYREGRRDEVVAGWKEDLIDFYRKLDCVDVITWRDAQTMPPKGYHPRARKIADDKWEDPDGRVYQLVLGVNEVQCVHDPTALPEPSFRVEDFDGPVDVSPPDPSIFEVLDAVIEAFGEDRYIAGPCGGTTAMTLLGGMEYGLMLYALQPEVIAAANRRRVQTQNRMDAHMVRPGVDGVIMDQDMGGTNAPLISPGMFRELCLPYMRERIRTAKQYCPQLIHHNCGHTIPLVDMLIDAGIDCYQSLQTTAGMEIGRLKDRFGDRLSFWGGVPVETLIAGTVAETRAAVRRALERGAPGSGFILGPSQSIAMNTKYDNFMAMLEEAA